jgi:hypothetical protein
MQPGRANRRERIVLPGLARGYSQCSVRTVTGYILSPGVHGGTRFASQIDIGQVYPIISRVALPKRRRGGGKHWQVVSGKTDHEPRALGFAHRRFRQQPGFDTGRATDGIGPLPDTTRGKKYDHLHSLRGQRCREQSCRRRNQRSGKVAVSVRPQLRQMSLDGARLWRRS